MTKGELESCNKNKDIDTVVTHLADHHVEPLEKKSQMSNVEICLVQTLRHVVTQYIMIAE